MSTSEILDRTFSLYRNNFLVFAGIAIFPAALALVLHVLGVTAHVTVRSPGRTLLQSQLMTVGYEGLVLFIATVIGGSIATGASVFAVYDLHLGRPATFSGSYKNVLAAWFRVTAAAILVFLLFVVISVLLFIALALALIWPVMKLGLAGREDGFIIGLISLGIIVVVAFVWLYLSAWMSFVTPAVLLDKNSIVRSLRRSHRLSQGSRGRIFIVLLLTGVLALVFTWTLRLPAEMLLDQRRQEIPLQLCRAIAQFLSGVVAGPIAAIAIALFYIDQRVRKEAFDLHLMMQSIQQDSVAAPLVIESPAPPVI